MKNATVRENEVFGFIKPKVDVHTLGISVIVGLINDCGYQTLMGGADVAEAADEIAKLDNLSFILKWIRSNGITRLGFSYRLDPISAQMAFGRMYHLLQDHVMFDAQGGPLRGIYFAGLPEACQRIALEYNGLVPVFSGDETPVETLIKLGVPDHKIPSAVQEGSAYDNQRLAFAGDLMATGGHTLLTPPVRGGYPGFGTSEDSLMARAAHRSITGGPPLMRVHVGPYNPDQREAMKEFTSWLKMLGRTGYLDIVSVGSSQLSQSDFGTDWGNRPNGGGVPINSEQDLIEIWAASRPMLVRTYAGTRNIRQLAETYEKNLNIAWHALSFWWFNRIDGRGPYGVLENLEQHFDTLRFIAGTDKPFEPNIPHHFSFRGGDDHTYVLSAYLAAIAAKKSGIRYLVLQTMLNTPKYTWGIQDLAKARALLTLVKELEDSRFKVYLQPRAGLDYFSPNLDKAKIQLAAVTAMMDDIEPANPLSPDIIHVVSYSEAVKLATPEIINESIQITLYALDMYRKMKQQGKTEDMSRHPELNYRTRTLVEGVKTIRQLLEKHIPDLYTPRGMYTTFQKGAMPVPWLWESRDEFAAAVAPRTALVKGGVDIVNEFGEPLDPVKRIKCIFEG